MKIGKVLKKNKNLLLTLGGLAAGAFALVDAVKITAEAVVEVSKMENPTTTDVYKTVGWKYARPAVAGIVAAGSVIFSDVMDGKEKKGLAMALAAASKAYKDYRNQNIETNSGAADYNVIDDMKRNELAKAEEVFGEEINKQTLFYEPNTKTMFMSTLKHVLGAEFLCQQQLMLYDNLALTDYLDYLDVNPDMALASGIISEYKLVNSGWCQDNCILRNGYSSLAFEHPEIVIDGKKVHLIKANCKPDIGYLDNCGEFAILTDC